MIALATAALLLTGCSQAKTTSEDVSAPVSAQPARSAAQSLLAEYDLAGLDGSEIVDRLDRMAIAERPSGLTASVRVDELLLSDATRETAVDLPEDRFYLSIAPYVDQTHDCFFHSLTTCKGELGGQDVHVTVVDDAGQLLVDESMSTFDNGFVGLWLPRDVAGTVRVSADGRTGEAPFSTDDEAATCLTTLRLT